MALASPFAPSLSAPFCSTYTESTRSTSTALSHSHQIRSFSLTARGFFSPKKVDGQYDLSHRFSRQCRLKGQPATEQVQARKSVIPAAAAAAGGDTANGGGVGANEVSATARYLRMSADKARRVIDQIRGRTYEEVLMILELMPYRACYPIFRLVYSAASNGSHNLGFNKADLVVSNAQVNVGPTMKRNRAKARGQSSRIKKRTCHITIVLKNTA